MFAGGISSPAAAQTVGPPNDSMAPHVNDTIRLVFAGDVMHTDRKTGLRFPIATNVDSMAFAEQRMPYCISYN